MFFFNSSRKNSDANFVSLLFYLVVCNKYTAQAVRQRLRRRLMLVQHHHFTTQLPIHTHHWAQQGAWIPRANLDQLTYHHRIHHLLRHFKRQVIRKQVSIHLTRVIIRLERHLSHRVFLHRYLYYKKEYDVEYCKMIASRELITAVMGERLIPMHKPRNMVIMLLRVIHLMLVHLVQMEVWGLPPTS